MGALAHRMFVSQTTLETWIDSGVAHVAATRVTLRATGDSFDLEPAVRFLATLPDREPSRLLGKVVTEAKVVELGGEVMGDSVLFGDAGFTIEPGYIATRPGGPS
jgi:hypothetical protein